MLTINKLRTESAIDFAAEELKKYLRMMMPEGGDIKIRLDPTATDGFRLGLLSDVGEPLPEGCKPELDDVIYIETDTRGGTIAGANPRAVLIAVYEYLRKCGCVWLFPGVDGEIIPLRDIVPVSYRHTPTLRVRGNCIEGAVSQQIIDVKRSGKKSKRNSNNLGRFQYFSRLRCGCLHPTNLHCK